MNMMTKQRGVTLVELMIAMLLSMVLAAAIISVFVNNNHSFKQDENIGRMQDDARHALREIAFYMTMAGFYADLHIPSTVSYDGEALEIGFNFGYLQDILKNIKSDTIVLSLKDSQSAALIKPVTEEGAETGVLCLLMPLRLAGD